MGVQYERLDARQPVLPATPAFSTIDLKESILITVDLDMASSPCCNPAVAEDRLLASEVQGNGAAPLFSIKEIERRVDNLSISADAKAILIDIARLTVEVGTEIVRVGQRILSFILDLVRAFPNTSFGLVVGYVVSSLIASVPLLGALLGPLLAPLLLALGLTAGAYVDLKDRALTSRVRVLEMEMVALTASQK